MNWKAQILIAASITLLGIGCTGELTTSGQHGPSGELSDLVTVDEDGDADKADKCLSPPCSDDESPADAGGVGDVGDASETVDTPDSATDPVPDPQPDPEPEPEPEPDPITPKVKILSPANGATVEPRVEFSISAEHVAKVQIKVDDWPLSDPWDPQAQTTLTYSLNDTGSMREVILYGYNSSGTEIARNKISIRVELPAPPPRPGKGTSLGTFINTYYYVEDENDFSGPKNAKLYDKNCNVIATVRSDFARLACIEGTAKVSDGRMLNYYNGTSCGGPCSFTWSAMSSSFPWGKGSRANALVPLLSWAVDTSIISPGTVLYVEEWDGMAIPSVGTLGGYTHDGCFRADDVGGGINGKHVDIFAGSKGMYRKLNALFVTRTNFKVYKNSPRCSHI